MHFTRTAIEPTLPEQHMAALEDMACSVVGSSAVLAGKVRDPLRREIAELTRWMHCYYSNLIEGQQTRVPDIEAALRHDFSAEPKKRDLQKIALAHLECQRWATAYSASPFAPDFICKLHQHFYSHLPAEMRVATTKSGSRIPLEPGVLRVTDVEVGSHLGPPHELVPELLDHFQSRYEEPGHSRIEKIVAVGASHHRLAWIHPFRDGNGRVVRQFSDKLIRDLGVDAGGLWSLSRGLAFKRKEYYERLANADQKRSSSSAEDGRGHLSERALRDFCEFVLTVMLDQISFMDGLLELDALAGRIEHYTHIEGRFGKDGARIFLLLREALYRGVFERGEAGRIVGAGERTGRATLAKAVDAGLLKSDSPKSPVRLALPVKVLGAYFPGLFPADQLHE